MAAYGSAKEPADLAQALRSLSTLTQEVIDSKDPQIVARGDSGLDKPLLSALSQLADDISALGSLGDAARAVAKVSQGEVDLWDGINLVLLERIIGLFQSRPRAEPSIPFCAPSRFTASSTATETAPRNAADSTRASWRPSTTHDTVPALRTFLPAQKAPSRLSKQPSCAANALPALQMPFPALTGLVSPNHRHMHRMVSTAFVVLQGSGGDGGLAIRYK